VSGSYDDDRSFAGGTKLGDFIVLGARLYDPETGRFISPDPIYQVINSFSYTRGNPVGFWDPDGREMFSIPPAAGPAIAHFGTMVALWGISMASAGFITGNPTLVIGGTVFVGLGSIMNLLGALKTAEGQNAPAPLPSTPSPTSPRVPLGMKLRLTPKTASAIECAPSALTSPGGGEGLLLWIVAVQLGLAVVWMRRRRRT
jgi:RHS repeat-associated protein